MRSAAGFDSAGGEAQVTHGEAGGGRGTGGG